MSSDTITLELDKYESGVVFHSLTRINRKSYFYFLPLVLF